MADETSDASQEPQPDAPRPAEQPPVPPVEADAPQASREPQPEPPPAPPWQAPAQPPAPWAATPPPQWPTPGYQPQPPQHSPQPYGPSTWGYPPPAGYGAPPPAPPARPFGLTPRFIAAVVAAGLVVGVAVALPIALIGRSSQPSTGGSGNPRSTGTPAPGAAAAARSLYQQALTATRAAKGVHYVAVTSGAADQHTTGDAGQSTGTQDITVTSGFGAEQFKLLLVNDAVFFQGNVPAEEDQVGLSPADAQRMAGKWITVVRGDGPFTVLQPGITTADQAAEMPLVAATTEQVTAGGRKVTRIHGTVPATAQIPAGTAYMDVDPSTHLPITYVSTVTAGKVTVSATTNFTNWGTAQSPSAPPDSVKWSTLNATEPPGGYGSGGGGQGTPAPA